MKKLIFLALLFSSTKLFAQAEYNLPASGCGVTYFYDANGNRIQRLFGCNDNPQYTRMANPATTPPKITTEESTANIKVYPNPTNDIFYVELTNPAPNTKMEVINEQGQVLSTQIISCSKLQYNLSGLSAGIYYVIITQDEKVSKLKVVKMKD